MDSWLGVLIMLVLGVGFAAVMIGLSVLLGPKNPTPEKLAPYECGIVPEVEPTERFSVVQFVAMARAAIASSRSSVASRLPSST